MLTFDAWQRCEITRLILEWCLPESIATILDVGGYPGRLKQLLPKHNWILCDPLVDSPGDQVKGSAVELPFQNQTFDLSISLDVLEHIAPEKRLAALSEMARVSRAGMILTFPYLSPDVTFAEAKVRETYQRLFKKEHPWLTEHQQFPLPNINEISAHLQSLGGQVAIFDVGNLARWVELQLADFFLETLPGSFDLCKEIDQLYETRLFPHDFQPPTYRKVIFHLFHLADPIPMDFIPPSRVSLVHPSAELQERLWLGIQKIFAAQQSEIIALEEKSEQSSLAREYLARLEQTQQIWETTYSDTVKELNHSYTWRDHLENRLSFKLYKRILRWLGRPIPS